MVCRSCRAKLSPRDLQCPSCGRKTEASRDLGSGASGAALPPAARAASPDEPALRLTEVVEAEADRNATSGTHGTSGTRSRGAGAAQGAPGRDDVRAMLAERPDLLEPGLSLYTEDGNPRGVAFGTPVGSIDLLLRDDAGAWVVVLLPERGREKELVGELLELMGWVRKHKGERGQEVRAIALLDSVPDDLGYAAAAVAGSVEFRRYKLALTFEPLDV